MPPAVAIISAIAAAASAGVGIYQATNQPKAPNEADILKQQQGLADQQSARDRIQAIRGQLSNAQSQTGGSLTDVGNLNLASILAGYPGGPGGPITGTTPNPTSSITPSSGGSGSLTDQLQGLISGQSSSFSGGSV